MMDVQIFPYIFLLFVLQSCIAHTHLQSSSYKVSFNLESLEQLTGVKRGDNLKGLHELKKYLTYLGYLNYDTLDDTYNSTDLVQQNYNIFDKSLESALKKYQQFYNLSVTGILDASTVTNMQKPRCGLPDFFHRTNQIVPFDMVSYYSFLSGHPKWDKRLLKYFFVRNVRDDAEAPIERAIEEWASKTRFKFSRVDSYDQADIKISFMPKYHGDGRPFRNVDEFAHTFPPPDGRVHFNKEAHWSVDGNGKGYDIQTVGLHELGHALGLSHSKIKEAAMHPIIEPGEIRKSLHEDDIEGVEALYQR